MKWSQQMMRLLKTPTLAKMSLDYCKRDEKGLLASDEVEFWDAINAELIRRGAV